MHTITFHCEVITPMFLAGADGQTPELRAPSIKGAMRFWWRAMNGNLGLEEMKRREQTIFGGINNGGQRSKVIIRISQPLLHISESPLVPHKAFMKKAAIQVGQQFTVTLSLKNELAYFQKEHLDNLFKITTILGGFGKRVRRGMGSVNIIGTTDQQVPPSTLSLPYIHELLCSFSSFYTLTNNSIQFNYTGRTENYGYISQIQLGQKGKGISTLRTISDATHKVKKSTGYAYEPSMGHAFKGRYASPVFVSVVESSLKPVITTLNNAPKKNAGQASLTIQEDFKHYIL